MKDQLENNVSATSSEKMKVLGLQELTAVAGGAAAWSTNSNNCGTVKSDEWSTDSNGCRTIQEKIF